MLEVRDNFIDIFIHERYDGCVCLSDNLYVLKMIPDEFSTLIYIDPPYNTNRKQKIFSRQNLQKLSYSDTFDNYLSFIFTRVKEAHRILKNNGTFYFHIDYRWSHYIKVFVLDRIFGIENFLSEIIWAFDFGGRQKDTFPIKHHNIFMYSKKYGEHIFNYDDIEKLPYGAPEFIKRYSDKDFSEGKLPTSVWWINIIPPSSSERVGYPSQKPIKLLDRIIKASSNIGDIVIDFFAGSGTVGEACLNNFRRFILVDNNYEAYDIMKARFKDKNVLFVKL